jgi:muramidase (phage lysozyme)
MIAWAEIGSGLLAKSDNGYNVLVGSTPSNPRLFFDYSDHPRILIRINQDLYSTAAGRYQILKRTYDAYKEICKVRDFSPASQDAIALQLIRERGALRDINEGRIGEAIKKVRNIWASFPGAGYQQHEQKLSRLIAAFVDAGGVMIG